MSTHTEQNEFVPFLKMALERLWAKFQSMPGVTHEYVAAELDKERRNPKSPLFQAKVFMVGYSGPETKLCVGESLASVTVQSGVDRPIEIWVAKQPEGSGYNLYYTLLPGPSDDALWELMVR